MTRYIQLEEFPGYRVGTDGSVWSCRLPIRGTRLGRTWHRLKPQVRRGYPRVGLWRNSKLHWRAVHRLILETFIGSCPEGMEGCHRDNNRSNNVLSNLRWDTPKNNAADSASLLDRGSNHRDAKLAESDIPAILARLAAGESRRSVARGYGVSHVVVNAIANGTAWRHVPR